MVQAPPKKYEPKKLEEAILAVWRNEGTFRQSVEQRRKGKPYVFLEGPPTANGMPHAGHVLTRTLKDVVCRYKTQRGHFVERKAGWDCHGLPVEIEVQKELGLKDIQAVEAYGVAAFNEKCRESVFRYKDVWEKMSERVGFWLDFDDPYVTMDNDYIESVWWSLKTLYEKKLLFRDYKVVPYCPQTGTSYSSHEVAQGYKTVTDLSLYVKFPIEGDSDKAAILSWTTTPWTLPGNVALAVGKDIDYVKVRVKKASDKAHAKPGDVLILAKSRVKDTLRHEVETLTTVKGADLVGKRYPPLFPGSVETKGHPNAHTVVAADFVTTEDGTGVVHTAVMYGEDDFRLGEEVGLPKQHTVDTQGKFVKAVGAPLAGRYVKECDQDIATLLEKNDRLYRTEAFEHQYPHCWRTGHPLLYYAMESWYVRMSSLRTQLLEANDKVNWYPETIKEGRFGEWLRNVKDWALSRKRYWGTPLPVWSCHGKGKESKDGCGKQVCVGSREQLKVFSGKSPEDLHRPGIDFDVACKDCGGTMRREPYVIDTWYDSGAAHFAQWHHPQGQVDRSNHFPADFITEGLDQTRGWFYTLIATGVSLFGESAFRNCMVGGLVLAEDGQKMSKSKKNYTDPWALFDTLGADAVRWSLLTTSAPWADKRFYDDAVRESLSRYLLTIWNTYSFFATYAALDGWTQSDIQKAPKPKDRPILDQWLLDRLGTVIEEATAEMERFNLHKATRALETFVVDDLSNWYVRRVRRRLWGEKDSADKRSCYATLHETLITLATATAPFTPFLAEHLYRALCDGQGPTSVHLADWPTRTHSTQDGVMESMATVRGLVEAARALRAKVDIGTRYPLREVWIVPTDDASQPNGIQAFLEIFAEETNAKKVTIAKDLDRFLRWQVAPEPGRIGPRFKQKARDVHAAIAAMKPEDVGPKLAAGHGISISIAGEEHALTKDDFRIEKVEAPGYANTKAEGFVIVLDTVQTPELIAEGLARELVRRIQDMRKQADLQVDDTIAVAIEFAAEPGVPVRDWERTIAEEVRAETLHWGKAAGKPALEADWDIDGRAVHIALARTKAAATEVAR